MSINISKKFSWLIAGFFFAALWASASTATKIGLSVAQPLIIALMRFAIAAVLLLLLAHVIMRQRFPKGEEWKQLAAYGFLNISVSWAFTLLPCKLLPQALAP